MSETDGSRGDEPEAERTGSHWWSRYRLHVHLGFWSILSIALVVVFLIFVSMSLTGRAIVMPGWVADRVETRLNKSLPEGAITLGRFELGVTPKGRPRLRLVDVGLRDASGLDIAQLNSIEGGVRLAPLFKGELVPRTAILSGAQITFRRLADGSFALRFGQGNTATGNLGDMIDAVDAVFAGGVLEEAGSVRAEGLTITLEDARSGRLWQVTDGQLAISQTEQIVETMVTFDVFNQTEELAAVDVTLLSDKETSEATLSVSFENARASDIGAQSPALSFLQLVDAPVAGALRTTVGANGALTDLAGVLSVDSGALEPTPGATPVPFGGAKGYVDFDPESDTLNLSSFTFSSDLGEIELDGKLIFDDFVAGWPQAVLGQLRLNRARLTDPRFFDDPVEVSGGYADMRVRFSPFEFDIGQAVLFQGDTRYAMSGKIGATRESWDLALDIEAPELAVSELKSIWPKTVSPKARTWVFDRVDAGTIHNVHIGLRGPQLKGADLLMGGRMTDGVVKVLPTLPAARNASGFLSISDREMTVSVDRAQIPSPIGGSVEAGGTTFTIPDLRERPGQGIADLVLEGPLQAGLGLLDLPPVEAFKATEFGPDVATGRFQASGRAQFPLTKNTPPEEIEYDIAGRVFGVRSDKVVPNVPLTSESARFTATPEMLTVWGDGRLGGSEASFTWKQPLGKVAAAEGSIVTGTVAVSRTLIDDFNLGLTKDMLSGAGKAQYELRLKPNERPRLSATSDLTGLRLAIPGTGWIKSPGASGKLQLTASLGDQPEVTDMSISAPGLSASGTVTTRDGGGLDSARFSRVRLGGWLDAPVTITGRGGRAIAIALSGGTADFRGANLDTGGGGGGSSSGPAQPLTIALDRLTIAEGIVLQNFRGDFDLAGGLSGNFNAQVTGGAPIQGTVVQTPKGAGFRIASDRGGEVLKGMNVFSMARKGDLEVTLTPTGETGVFEGDMRLTETFLVDAPAMAELLAAISVVGLLDQLDGNGIFFSEAKGRFRLSPERVTLYSSSAISSSLGLSMDGYYNLADQTMDMQGVVSPFYLINSIGRIVSARDGEGLVGFSFTLTGPAKDLNVGVNPLSLLTPGFLREMFRRQAPQRPGGTAE